MNWFDTSGLTSLAKTALKEAQKKIDKALDIQDESGEELEDESPTASAEQSSPGNDSTPQDNADFFASWGLTVSAECVKDDPIKNQPVVTASPSKSTPQSAWGSFFEESKNPNDDSTIVRPPKAKSMNVICDTKYDSQDNLFSKSQLVMSDGEEFKSFKKDNVATKEDRHGSSRSNRLSLVSSRNSSDSVEVLSQSLKSTPDSEASALSMSHSSSMGQKLNSESVEILPDSLVSPSSIEYLGFDSLSSDKNSSTSSNLTPDMSDKKSTPVGESTDKVDTADSVSLVAEDDEDTMSYNSISECTAPTVLDTDEKPISPFPRALRAEPRKELIHLEQAMLPKIQMSENSSNDGSWSDRTLNADNDSINLDMAEEQKKNAEQEDILMDKLSDSSSFYNVNVTSSMLQSESSAFVNVEKQQCNATSSSGSSQKDGSVKERTSPISSDSKSDLVKIGSDRTSGHTSGDELETTTSSDIEIIPSPNGDNGHGFCRNSPAKYGFKQGKFDGTTSPNLVDLVLGKSLATKIRGHNRELSEASVQSNTSDDSQSSENDRLMRRLSEMTEILEARENRLMEVTRSNAELVESNADLKHQMECLLTKHRSGDSQEGGDINTITEDYTQRMSALEKKFQQAIRDKDQLRKQLDSLKCESSRKLSSELENSLKEKDEVIVQLQEEGEKLARQQLQHSNIIKKLRLKEKDNEQVIKSLRDKIAEQTAELDRLKRSMAAKEELEVNQIEAVYRLTTSNKKLETELGETKSLLDDTTQRLESSRTSLEAARRSLTELQRSSAELQRRRSLHAQLDLQREHAERERERAAAELRQLRADVVSEEKKWRTREEALRRELNEARDLCAALEAGTDREAGTDEEAGTAGGGGVLAQLAALQAAALDRERAHRAAIAVIANQRDELERVLAKAVERERMSREESQMQVERLLVAEGLLQAASDQSRQLHQRADQLDLMLNERTQELETLKNETETRISDLEKRVSETEQLLAENASALDTEKKRNAILQEQLSVRGDISPVQSLASDTMSASLWHSEEAVSAPVPSGASNSNSNGTGAGSAACVEGLLAVLSRREGELRAACSRRDQLLAERDALRDHAARLQASLDDYQSVQEQYDALLQMYGEKEEQVAELRLDLHDVTQLYKAQLDELVALKQRQHR